MDRIVSSVHLHKRSRQMSANKGALSPAQARPLSSRHRTSDPIRARLLPEMYSSNDQHLADPVSEAANIDNECTDSECQSVSSIGVWNMFTQRKQSCPNV